MKLFISALVALLTINANAAVQKKHEIKMLNANSKEAMKLLSAGDYYGTGLAVGRVNPFTMKVELVNLVMPDPASITTPKKLVKGVIDISSTSPGDPDADQAAEDRLDFFFSTKTGWNNQDNTPRPVAKIVSVVFDAASVTPDQTSCMGLDQEIVDGAGTKQCFVVRPSAIIQHNL